MASTSSGSTSSAAVAGHLGRGGRARRDDHRALGHGLEHGEAEPLAQARVADDRGRSVEGVEVGTGHEPEAAGARVGQGRPSRPAPRARARRRRHRGERTPRAAAGGSCGARPCRRRARTVRSSPYCARTRATSDVGHGDGVGAPRARRAGAAASIPASRQSARVASDGQRTMAASSRDQGEEPLEHGDARRVKCAGLVQEVEVVDGGHPGRARRRRRRCPVAWTTSTGPVARSTRGRRRRCHDVVQRRPRERERPHRDRSVATPRARDRRWRALTPTWSTSPRAATAATVSSGSAGGPTGHPVPALLEGDGHSHQGFGSLARAPVGSL